MKKTIAPMLLLLIAATVTVAELTWDRQVGNTSITLTVDTFATDSSRSDGTIALMPTYGYKEVEARIIVKQQIDSTLGSAQEDSGIFILNKVFAGEATLLGVDTSGAFPCTLSVTVGDTLSLGDALQFQWFVLDTVTDTTATGAVPTFTYPVEWIIKLTR